MYEFISNGNRYSSFGLLTFEQYNLCKCAFYLQNFEKNNFVDFCQFMKFLVNVPIVVQKYNKNKSTKTFCNIFSVSDTFAVTTLYFQQKGVGTTQPKP